MTVLLRWGDNPAEDTVTPHIPTLSILMNRVMDRKLPRSEPLIVQRSEYEMAEQEMIGLLKQRGYSDLAHCAIPQRNFLLLNTPIVCGF